MYGALFKRTVCLIPERVVLATRTSFILPRFFATSNIANYMNAEFSVSKFPIIAPMNINSNPNHGKIQDINNNVEEMKLDSVLRKRKHKMKKHKLRKRRRAQRAMRQKMGK